MKTPINGARLSSPFGMRKHPIDGFNKMHRGTDFAAAEGTQIMPSCDGKIVRGRWCWGGGNCIKIRHNSTYETVYAHLKNFARGIKEGRRVNTKIIASNIAMPVKIPKYIVGIKLDKTKIEKPNTIVIEVFKIAIPTVE